MLPPGGPSVAHLTERGGQEEPYVGSKTSLRSPWHGPVSQISELTLETAESLTRGNSDFLIRD